MRIATRYHLRQMTLSDIPQVMEVERESFPTMWPPTAFKRELQQNRLAHYIVAVERNHQYAEAPGRASEPPHRHGGVGRLLHNVLHNEEAESLPPPERRPELIIGFAGVWMLPDEAHLVSIAVRQSHRRLGIGERLLISAIEMAQRRGQAMVTLECRVSNEAALAMYEKCGFRQAGLRPRYYSDNHEDAYIMTASGIGAARYQSVLQDMKAEHVRRWGDVDASGEW